MALGTNKLSAIASPGMAAAATARTVSGGRNVASVGRDVEASGFAPQIEVNDNRLWRFDDERSDLNRDHRREEHAGGFVARAYSGFRVEDVEETADTGAGRVFLDALMRAISIYEANTRLFTPGAIRPGSVMNFRL